MSQKNKKPAWAPRMEACRTGLMVINQGFACQGWEQDVEGSSGGRSNARSRQSAVLLLKATCPRQRWWQQRLKPCCALPPLRAAMQAAHGAFPLLLACLHACCPLLQRAGPELARAEFAPHWPSSVLIGRVLTACRGMVPAPPEMAPLYEKLGELVAVSRSCC